jgi:PAS domain S-box-containing protein
MSWVTIIWSMIASVSFTLATIYLLIWFRERRSWAYLCFFVLAVGVIGMATGELAAMYAKSPAAYGAAIRWGHFAYGFIAVGSLGFVHFYFGTGKWWLLGAALGLRLLAVVVNFSTGLNLHISAIQSLQQVNFLGEPVSMLGVWTLNPWVRLGQFAALVQFIYVADASFRLWRTGSRESRRQAVIVGGSLAFFILFSSAQAGLVAAGVLRMPIVVSFPFLAVLLAMSYELSRDALRAAQLGRELRESEQQMAMATEAANLGVWVRDLVRNEILANAKWRALFGFTPAERLDLEKFLQRLQPDDHESFRQAVAKAASGDGRYEAEFRVVLPDGRMRWINSRGRVEFDSGGKPVRVRGISVDITDRKRTEEANRNAQELMAAVFNSVPGLLYLYTEDGQIVQWNKQHEEMTGFTSEELLNRRAGDWYDEEDRITFDRAIRTIFSEGYAEAEMKLIHKNGEKVPYFLTGSKVIINGKPHLVGIAIDISARKKAEELLRESEERMTLAAEAANLGVWVRDLTRNTIWASDQWRALFGFSPAERLDLEMLLQRIHPDDRDAIRLAMARANDGDGQYEVEFRVVLPDGRMRWVVSRGQVEFNGGGKPVRVRGVSMDITTRKQAEADVSQQRAELAHLTRVTMLGELSGSMAHELNQPLTAILSNAQAAIRFLAHDNIDLNEVRDILKDIVEQDNRAGEVIRRLRLLLKKGEVRQQPLDLNDVVQEVLKLIRSDLVNHSVVAHTELATDLPPVKGDRVQLQQVLLNLVMNACDAMNGNSPADRQLVVRTELCADKNVRVSVADCGVGLAPDKLEQVFMPFYTTKPHGLGLGLSVCRTIITAHGGNLRAANGEARGAVFYFTIPSLEEAGA